MASALALLLQPPCNVSLSHTRRVRRNPFRFPELSRHLKTRSLTVVSFAITESSENPSPRDSSGDPRRLLQELADCFSLSGDYFQQLPRDLRLDSVANTRFLASVLTMPGDNGKQRRKKRGWTPTEERCLIDSMKQIIADGWKSENGFRSGYLCALEQCFLKLCPDSTLRADPHMASKLHGWKTKYYQVVDVLSRSGVGWDPVNKMILAIDELWKEIIQASSKAATLRNKAFPMYDDWEEIFGKDRATGEEACGFPDSVDQGQVGEGSTDPPATPNAYSPSGATSAMNENQEATSGSNKKRKRISEGSMDIVSLIKDLTASTNEAIHELSSKLGHDVEVLRNQRDVAGIIRSLPLELSVDQVLDASMDIMESPAKTQLFMSLNEGERVAMVSRVCRGVGYFGSPYDL